jgi:hypothetical protein
MWGICDRKEKMMFWAFWCLSGLLTVFFIYLVMYLQEGEITLDAQDIILVIFATVIGPIFAAFFIVVVICFYIANYSEKWKWTIKRNNKEDE